MDRPLPSWRDTDTRAAILDFVASAVDGPDAIAPADRVAVFDNDGTLWSEKPMPVQLHFILGRWKVLAAEDPSLAERQPYKAALSGDLSWLAGALDKHYNGDDSDLKVLIGAVVESQAGLGVEAFAEMVETFMQEARHPTLGTPYAATAYQPMLELLELLRANDFSVYITSGGDRDFMRVFAEELYGVSSESVIGSTLGLEYREDDTGGHVAYGTSFSFLDDGPQKPIRIWSRIGRRPVLAAGNSNGDIPMLAFVQGHPRSLSLLVHHDDEGRGDIAYDTGADLALKAARDRDWTVVSVRDDWDTVFADPT
jgi:phosphoserine phosphatase